MTTVDKMYSALALILVGIFLVGVIKAEIAEGRATRAYLDDLDKEWESNRPPSPFQKPRKLRRA